MNKSIYEEALEIVAATLDLSDRSVIFKHTSLNVIKKALEQAIKDEKLLKQHQKIASAIVRISIEQPIYVIKESERESVEQSFNRIKELENDI